MNTLEYDGTAPQNILTKMYLLILDIVKETHHTREVILNSVILDWHFKIQAS